MDRGYQHYLKKKLLSEINETHRNWKSSLLKQNIKEEKEMLSFVTQYQPLVSTLRGFNGKAESHTKPTTTLNFAKFLNNHLLFSTRKENHGKDVKDQHTVSPV